VIGDPMEVAYNSVYLWKLAVEKAKSFDVLTRWWPRRAMWNSTRPKAR
jgi:hypothetical protein